jgi:hypothetical protein
LTLMSRVRFRVFSSSKISRQYPLAACGANNSL